MGGKRPTEGSTVGTTQPQQTVVGGQHGPVVVDNVRVVMVRQDVVEGDVLDDVRIVEDELDVIRAVQAGAVPELQQRLLVLMDGNARLGELRVEELPEL